MSSTPSTQRLSCRRCQSRKIRCDRSQPCANCLNRGSTCEYRVHDHRRRPVSHAYVTALETRVAWHESLLQRLKVASAEAREELLREASVEDHFKVPGQSPQAEHAALKDRAEDQPSPVPIGSLRRGTTGALQYHGPTSIYLDEDGAEEPPSKEASRPTTANHHPWSDLRLASALGIDEALIRESLAAFFSQQDPQYMFVYREAFLADYFALEHGGKYWSFALLYAVCALGAARSSSASHRNSASVLARCASEIIITHGLERPAYTTVQALLCLAFYEVGQNNSSKGWLLSGMAFRMGQDLGFHRDPKRWKGKDASMLTACDFEIRRRIYWGCYVADKFMSLYLGRPVSLVERDAEVNPVEPLPDFPDDHGWFGLEDLAAELSCNKSNERPQLTMSLRYMVTLGEIFQDIVATVFSPKGTDRASMMDHVDKFNLQLSRWHSQLPHYLQWSQWSQKGHVRLHILVLHLFYHSISLSLNRHFIDDSSTKRFKPHLQSQSLCSKSCDMVVALVRQYRNQVSAKKPPLILLNALVVVAMTIATASGRAAARQNTSIGFVLKVLAECSPDFQLAGEMRRKLTGFLRLAISPTDISSNEGTRNSQMHHLDPGEATSQDRLTSEASVEPQLGLEMPPDYQVDLSMPLPQDDGSYDFILPMNFEEWFIGP